MLMIVPAGVVTLAVVGLICSLLAKAIKRFKNKK